MTWTWFPDMELVWRRFHAMVVRGHWIKLKTWCKDLTLKQTQRGTDIVIIVVALCLMLFGVPGWVPHPVVSAQQKRSADDLTIYRVDQIELSNKSMDAKIDMLVLGQQKVQDRLDTIDKRTDDTRWWIGMILASLGVIGAMKAPEVLERWRRR